MRSWEASSLVMRKWNLERGPLQSDCPIQKGNGRKRTTTISVAQIFTHKIACPASRPSFLRFEIRGFLHHHPHHRQQHHHHPHHQQQHEASQAPHPHEKVELHRHDLLGILHNHRIILGVGRVGAVIVATFSESGTAELGFELSGQQR